MQRRLVPVVIVDARTNGVLTLAYANREALERRSPRSRRGSTAAFAREAVEQRRDVREHATRRRDRRSIATGCADLPRHPERPGMSHRCRARAFTICSSPSTAKTNGGAFRPCDGRSSDDRIRRGADTSQSYTAKLFAGGVDRIGKKIGEEATEVVIAAKNEDRGELVWEAATCSTTCWCCSPSEGVTLDEIGDEFQRRARLKRESLAGLAGIGPATAASIAEMGIATPERFARAHSARV